MIPVKNIYHMLSYAFQNLQESTYRSLGTEEFENIVELCGEILIRGLSQQIKRGLLREYITHQEVLSSPKGKIGMSESIKEMRNLRHQLYCSHDEFSINFPMHRILKSTMLLLLRSKLTRERKVKIRRLLMYFPHVNTVDLTQVNWSMRFHRNNQSYQMLISISHLLVKGLLQTEEQGSQRLMQFVDNQSMSRLYEKFILSYYQKEFPQLTPRALQVPWDLDNDMQEMLPRMQTDITLSHKETTLIIDAKYYANSTQQRYERHTIHSGNLYQIFTYVKNKDAEKRKELKAAGGSYDVSGLLLYAKTDETVTPDVEYSMGGNRIGVKTLDLDRDFTEIAAQLDQIVAQYFII